MAWTRAATLDDVWEGVPFPVDLQGTLLALYRLGDEVLAAGDLCPHEPGVRLSQGWLDGDTIECPMHQSCFNLRTGEVLCPPACSNIPVYPVKVEDGQVLVQL
jgi:nitrite reductase/ring-hydroxylating ferredoxin subunit